MRKCTLEKSTDIVDIKPVHYIGEGYTGWINGVEFILVAKDAEDIGYIVENLLKMATVDQDELAAVIVAQKKGDEL